MVTVREVLDCLGRSALGRLADIRNVATARELNERRRILSHSYRGDLVNLVKDLRREDLIAVLEDGITMDGTEYSVPGLSRMSVDEIRELATKLLVHNVKPRSLEPVSTGRNVLNVRAQENNSGMQVVQVFSTRYAEGDVASLGLGALRERLESAQTIDIASAYYDPEFIENLLVPVARTGATPSVRMVFNGLGGSRLREQKNDLRNLQAMLRQHKGLCDLEIRLQFEDGIFHSKLILIERRGLTAFVGSANATMAAMEINEELLLEIRGAGLLSDYFTRVWTRAKPIDDIEEPRATSLVAFFRTGTLFFKPPTQLQFSYNPFSRLLTRLTQEDMHALEVRPDPIPNAEPETGIGPYSIKRALRLEDSGEDSAVRTKSPAVGAYCIETCFGYWVPTAFQKEFEQKLKVSGSAKEESYRRLEKVLSEKDDHFFVDGFEEYRQAVRKIFDQAGIEVTRYQQPTESDPFTGPHGFETFLHNIRTRLANRDYMDRLCQPFVSAPMPEIWDDPVARLDFTNSFFEYLEFVANKSGNGHRVPSQLRARCGYSSGDSASRIQKTVETFLRENGWSTEDWFRRE